MTDLASGAAGALLIAETALSLVLLTHALLQLSLARASRRFRSDVFSSESGDAELPRVTIQLPVYNERTVVQRLLEHVARLDYPQELLEVQVLDDSTDETSALIAAGLLRLSGSGITWRHLRRASRTGFKAGALREGLACARGELVAVLDADFMPTPEFLRTMVPYFVDPSVAAVQSRWGHANSQASLLTRVQALLLDTHFTVEQLGRSTLGYFVNFNGSAGIWRAGAIRDAGNWSEATLTEDLDLSYRAQLRGWRIVYLDRVLATAELPESIATLRVQQRRWMIGVAQSLVRLTPKVLSAHVRPSVKLHAVAHLAESTLYLVTLGVPLLATLIVVLDPPVPVLVLASLPPAFLAGAAVLFVVYRTSLDAGAPGRRDLLAYTRLYLAFFFLSLGLSVHNSVAVLRGLSGRPAGFERTPKIGVAGVRGYGAPRGIPRVAGDAAVATSLAVLCGIGFAQGTLLWQWLGLLAFAAVSTVIVTTLRATRQPGPR